MEGLPDEILELIFDYLTMQQLLVVMRVCKKWNHLLQTSTLFWKQRYLRDPFPECNGTEWRNACFRREYLQLFSRNSFLCTNSHSVMVMSSSDPNKKEELTFATDKKRHFLEPTPSPNGRKIAFTQMSKHEYHVAICNYDETDLISIRVASPPFYYCWSPNSRYVTWLSNSQDSMTFQIIDIESKPYKSIELSRGRPFFFAFSPDSTKLITHTGHDEVRLFTEPYTAESSQKSILISNELGFFMAPKWLSDSNDLFLISIRHHDQEQALVIYSLSENAIKSYLLITELQNRIWFQPSPDGKYLAYSITDPERAEKLAIFSLTNYLEETSSTGIKMARDRVKFCKTFQSKKVTFGATHSELGMLVGEARAYFWSPDSKKIAYLETADDLVNYHFFGFNTEQYKWGIFDLEKGSIYQIGENLTPSIRFSQYLNFFDQYSISLRLWSSNSACVITSTTAGVKVYDAYLGGLPPKVVVEGDNASFSWI